MRKEKKVGEGKREKNRAERIGVMIVLRSEAGTGGVNLRVIRVFVVVVFNGFLIYSF